MTRIAIVGGGKAATLHAEAARATAGVELIGVGGRVEGSAGELARATGVPDLPLAALIKGSDGLVIAVPPRAVPQVLSAVPPSKPVLLELPTGIDHAVRPRAVTAANLLHATTTKQALRAIRDLEPVHHLVMRLGASRPDWGLHGSADFGGGVLIDPSAAALAVLLAAAGSPVVRVAATVHDRDVVETAAVVRLELDDGRIVRADLRWDPAAGGTEIEAAGETGVVNLRLWPRPGLEVDGDQVAVADEPPLVAFGFVEQMRRFAAVAAGRDDPWLPRSVADGIAAIAESAARSAISGGALVPIAIPATSDPGAIFAGSG